MKCLTEVFSGVRDFAGWTETWEIITPYWGTTGSLKVSSVVLACFWTVWLSAVLTAYPLWQTWGSSNIPQILLSFLLCPGLSICRGRSFFSFGMSLTGRGALKQGVLSSQVGLCSVLHTWASPSLCVTPVYRNGECARTNTHTQKNPLDCYWSDKFPSAKKT